MMKSSSISVDDLQEEEFIADNENEDVKGDWVLLIIQKDIAYKTFIFQLKSNKVCEMMEEDLEIKECQYNVAEVNPINWKNILKYKCTTRIISKNSLRVSTQERPRWEVQVRN